MLVLENQDVSCRKNQPKRVLIFASICLNRQCRLDLSSFIRAIVQQGASTALLAYVKLKTGLIF